MKIIIFLFIIFYNSYIFSEDLKTIINQQIKFFTDNSYSCIFSVPDSMNHNLLINALIPMHTKVDCSDNYINNEEKISEGDRLSTGDSILFSAIMCRSGLNQFCDNIKILFMRM